MSMNLTYWNNEKNCDCNDEYYFPWQSSTDLTWEVMDIKTKVEQIERLLSEIQSFDWADESWKEQASINIMTVLQNPHISLTYI